MCVTSLCHVNGATDPSSKKECGKVAACGGPDSGPDVNEVVDGPLIAMEFPIDRFVFMYGSFRVRAGELPFIESIDVAGYMPPATKDRRDLCYSSVSWKD